MSPVCIEISSKNENGYIVNDRSNDISVFNKKTNEIVATIPVGKRPTSIQIIKNGQIAVIIHDSEDGLWVMSTKDNQIINKIPGIKGASFNDTLNKKIYISAVSKPYVFVFDAVNLSIIKNIKVGGVPYFIASGPDGKFIYVTNWELNEVEKIDTQLDSVVNRIPIVKYPYRIIISGDGKYAYVTNKQII